MIPDFSVTRAPGGRWRDRAVPRPELRELVEAAQAGDVSAWDELYRRLYPRLLAYARRQVGVDPAADLVSDAMVRALAGLGRFRWTGAGFEAWIFRILRHVVIDHHRRNGREVAAASRERHVRHDDTADAVMAGDEARALRAAFGRLGADDQELLHLRVVAGLSSEEVAHVLGKRQGAVRMAQARALQRLRVLLAQAEDGRGGRG